MLSVWKSTGQQTDVLQKEDEQLPTGFPTIMVSRNVGNKRMRRLSG